MTDENSLKFQKMYRQGMKLLRVGKNIQGCNFFFGNEKISVADHLIGSNTYTYLLHRLIATAVSVFFSI